MFMNTDTVKPNQTAINPIDSLLVTIATAVESWKVAQDPEELKKTIFNKLDSKRDEVMLKLLGFNDSWGKWEVDHCNGRSGESSIGDFLKTAQQKAIKEWLATSLPLTLSPKTLSSLQKSVQKEYELSIRRELHSAVRDKADKDLECLLGKILGSNQLANYIKAMKLINPTE